jgi:hypothetical protein
MVTSASATGSPLSRLVTQTREDSRPFLRCADMLVTRAADDTYIGRGFPRRAAPRIGLSISTM